MADIQIFNNPEFGQIRTVEINNEPYFVGFDIAQALGYQNISRDINAHVDDEDKLKYHIGTSGQNREMIVINESGMYSLIMQSKLPQAKQFKRWVTAEVLPTIRKHGAYMSEDVIAKTIENPDFIIQLATALKQERTARQIAEQEANEKQKQIEVQKPYADFGQAVAGSTNSILIRELAKIITSNGYPIGQNRMFGWLRENGYINSYNEPYQQFVERGLFVRIENVISHNGRMVSHFTTKVTGKGQMYFVNKFKEKV